MGTKRSEFRRCRLTRVLWTRLIVQYPRRTSKLIPETNLGLTAENLTGNVGLVCFGFVHLLLVIADSSWTFRVQSQSSGVFDLGSLPPSSLDQETLIEIR